MRKPRKVSNRIPNDAMIAIMSRPWRRMGEWKAPVLYEDIYCQGLLDGVPEFFPGFEGPSHFLHCAPVSYQDAVEYSRHSRRMVEHLNRNPSLLPQTIAQFQKRLDTLSSYNGPKENLKLGESLSGARRLVLAYLNALYNVMAYSYIFNWGRESVVGETARNFIRSVQPRSDVREIYRSFFEPPPPAGAHWLREEQALTDLAEWVIREHKNASTVTRTKNLSIKDLEQDSPELYVRLLKISKDYGWLGVRHMLGEPRTTLYYFQQIKETLAQGAETKRKALTNIGAESEHRFKEFLASSQLTADRKEFLVCARDLVGLSTLRVEAISRSAWAMRPIFKKVANAENMSLRLFLDHTWTEMQTKSKSKSVSRATLRSRAAGYTYIILNGELHLATGREHSLIMALLSEFEKRGPVILRGQSAAAGLSLGKAKVIQSENPRIIKKEEVVVIEDANQLDTRWLKKVTAIIADQGGILSKAASYARELGIPCVTGTVNATETIRDGDLVEVDGNTGICAIRRQRPPQGALM